MLSLKLNANILTDNVIKVIVFRMIIHFHYDGWNNNIFKFDSQNLVELETRVIELRLDHNKLQDLSGALMGLTSLQRLNLSFNKLNHISPDDFIGLDNLKILDISHNMLTTLEETSKVTQHNIIHTVIFIG